jgi:hypothetical protein
MPQDSAAFIVREDLILKQQSQSPAFKAKGSGTVLINSKAADAQTNMLAFVTEKNIYQRPHGSTQLTQNTEVSGQCWKALSPCPFLSSIMRGMSLSPVKSQEILVHRHCERLLVCYSSLTALNN